MGKILYFLLCFILGTRFFSLCSLGNWFWLRLRFSHQIIDRNSWLKALSNRSSINRRSVDINIVIFVAILNCKKSLLMLIFNRMTLSQSLLNTDNEQSDDHNSSDADHYNPKIIFFLFLIIVIIIFIFPETEIDIEGIVGV